MHGGGGSGCSLADRSVQIDEWLGLGSHRANRKMIKPSWARPPAMRFITIKRRRDSLPRGHCSWESQAISPANAKHRVAIFSHYAKRKFIKFRLITDKTGMRN